MATSLCNGCQSFFSHCPSRVVEPYYFPPAAFDPTKRYKSANGRPNCSFCAYLNLVAPEYLLRYPDRGFYASLGLAIRPTWSTLMDSEFDLASKMPQTPQVTELSEMIVLRLSHDFVSEPFLQLSLLKRSGTLLAQRPPFLDNADFDKFWKVTNVYLKLRTALDIPVLPRPFKLLRGGFASVSKRIKYAGESQKWSATALPSTQFFDHELAVAIAPKQ